MELQDMYNDQPRFMYVVVRKKGFTPEQQMNYAINVAVNATAKFFCNKEHPNIKILQVKRQVELIGLSYALDKNNVKHVKWIDPDHLNEITAIATGPITFGSKEMELFREFKGHEMKFRDVLKGKMAIDR